MCILIHSFEKSTQLSSEKINRIGDTIVLLNYSVILIWDLHPNLCFSPLSWKMFYAKSFEVLVLFILYLKF